MNKTCKILTLSSFIFLSGCMGQQATFSERMQDSFIFSSASDVTGAESQCFVLSKPFTLPSGSVTYSIPAGKYIAKKKNNTGYFYYAPDQIKSSNWLISSPQEGIYLNNQFTSGNLFGRSPNGFLSRPVRGAVLPGAIFSYIKRC